MKRIGGHRRTDDPLVCSCGAQFRSRSKLGRHRQKWNSRYDLRDQKLRPEVRHG